MDNISLFMEMNPPEEVYSRVYREREQLGEAVRAVANACTNGFSARKVASIVNDPKLSKLIGENCLKVDSPP